MANRWQNNLLRLSLLAMVVSAPAAVVAYLAGGPSGEVPRALVLARAGTTDATATPTPAGSGAGPSTARLVTGVLFTNGNADVFWNDRRLPVNSGSYAYVGGEAVEIGPQSMGVLELAGGNRVYLCPGTRASLSPAPAGGYEVALERGAARFLFPRREPVAVQTSGRTLALEADGNGEAGLLLEVATSGESGQVTACEFSGFVAGSSGAGTAAGGGGPIVYAEAGSAGGLSRRELPPGIDTGAAAGEAGGYLCRCEELERYARAAEEAALAAAQSPADGQAEDTAGQTEATVAQAAASPAPPSPAPPVEPPTGPGAALAPPSLSSAFDPNLLAPPAAGPPGAGDAAAAPGGVGPTVAAPAVGPLTSLGGGVLSSAL